MANSKEALSIADMYWDFLKDVFLTLEDDVQRAFWVHTGSRDMRLVGRGARPPLHLKLVAFEGNCVVLLIFFSPFFPFFDGKLNNFSRKKTPV